jgi:hypothetical protein
MEFAVLVFAYAIVPAIGFAKSDRTPVRAKESKCLSCVYVVVARELAAKNGSHAAAGCYACDEVHGVRVYRIPCDFGL